MSTAYKGILYAVITAALWSVLAIVMKVSLRGLTPADITWFRFVLAFTILAFYYYLKKPHYLRILKRPPLILVIATLCLAANYYGFIEGVNLTTPSIAQVFIQLGPVLLAVAGFIFFREKVTWRQITGLILSAAGLLVFYNEQLNLIVTGKAALHAGIIWILVAAITWAVYSVLLKVLVTRYPPMQLNLVVFGLPAILYFPFVNFHHFTSLHITGWLILLFMGLNTLIAYGLLSLAIHYIEANKISVILILNPILTFVLMAVISGSGATWIQHEHYSLITLAGAMIVLAGAVLTVFKKNKSANAIGYRNNR
jgi:drug/metabolite transporter (DMT)-like permease